MALYLGHGIGFNDQRAPWAAGSLFGKSGTTLAVWNTFRIPFSAGVRVDLAVPAGVNVSAPEHYYVILRGAAFDPAAAGGEAYPWPTLGGWRLPPTARLRLLATERTTLQPLDTLGLVQLPAGRAGGLLLTVLQVLSGNANFLEGCLRASWDGGEPELLSSGTEDYFASSFYFSGVPDGFYSPNSGLTHLESNATSLAFSAYKAHVDDIVVWRAGTSVNITWRNGDVFDPPPGSGLKCTANGTKLWDPQPSVVSAYAFVYTW